MRARPNPHALVETTRFHRLLSQLHGSDVRDEMLTLAPETSCILAAGASEAIGESDGGRESEDGRGMYAMGSALPISEATED